MKAVPRRGAARRVAVACIAALVALVAGACDPCAGVPACRVGPRVSYSGRVIDFETGRGVAGVTVTFRAADGSLLAGDSLVARTDGEGRFRLSAAARPGGDVVGDVTIAAPAPRLPYGIRNVRLRPTDARGAGGVLETWTAQPYVAWVGAVVSRRTGRNAIWGFARFRRTGGARLAGDERIQVEIDPDGYFFIEAQALDTGAVVGDLTITGGGLDREYLVRDVRLPVRVVDRRPTFDRRLIVGLSLEYALELRSRPGGAPVAGADVEFRRTGGIPLLSDLVTGRTAADGRVRLAPAPVDETPGVIVGDLTVRAPASARPFVIRGIRLETFDSDELRFAGVFGVGHAVQSAGELVHRGDRAPLADAEVRFVRTGGLPVPAGEIVTRPLPDGRFAVQFATDTAGEVVGDLVVVRPGAAPTAFRGVRLLARADDSVRYVGRFAVGAQLSYAGILVDRATGRPAADWTVIFRRTGGIRLAVDTLVSRVLDWGGFGLSPPTREEGTVTGTLTARSPAGDRDVPLGVTSLATFDGDEVRLAGRWAVGPSLLYVGELRRDDTGAPVVGARAEFRRTGGIRTTDAVAGETSNGEGRFRMQLTPLESGDVVGDLYVFPPAPLRDTVFRDVRVPTFESDETRLFGVWRLAPPR